MVGGDVEVGDVSDLRLMTETEAAAKFRWTASLNELGKLFFPNQLPAGMGGVAFGKKPDGTWFVDHFEIASLNFRAK